MKLNKKSISVLLIATALIIASIPVIFIVISYIPKEENIQIDFTPNMMKSCPNHTAWFLLDIRTRTDDIMSNLSLYLNTNSSIDMNYSVWNNSPVNRLIEIFLTPNSSHVDNFIEIEVKVSSRGIIKQEVAVLQVVNWTIAISPEIEDMRDEFINYLSTNHTKFNITGTTIWEWLGNPPQIIIVEHYLFKSTYWEMELARHATIYPHDWVQVYLRHRSSLFPNWSGIISSWSSGNYTIIEQEPPNQIYR
jgi:hypothetical protein